jgi:hypothetical protein
MSRLEDKPDRMLAACPILGSQRQTENHDEHFDQRLSRQIPTTQHISNTMRSLP